jgi:hypothetical protein
MNTLQCGFRSLALVALACAAGMLTGCATSRQVESDVRSFAGTVPVTAGASYRFERLPSQTAEAQEPLETAAQKTLTTKGLTLDNAKARYSVQLRLEADAIAPDALHNWGSTLSSDRILIAPNGTLWREVRRPLIEASRYRHSLHVVVRDLGTAAVAFETRAVHEGSWSDTINLIAPLTEAALADFPQGEPTPKSVVVVLPKAP